MILIALALALITIYCGMNLLSKAKKENLGMLFTLISWLIVIGGTLIMGFACCRGIRNKCCMSPNSQQCGKCAPANCGTTTPGNVTQPAQQQQQQGSDSIPHGGGGNPK